MRYKSCRNDPFTYNKNETDHHVCHNCENEFVGDDCPTCGLKAESWTSARHRDSAFGAPHGASPRL